MSRHRAGYTGQVIDVSDEREHDDDGVADRALLDAISNRLADDDHRYRDADAPPTVANRTVATDAEAPPDESPTARHRVVDVGDEVTTAHLAMDSEVGDERAATTDRVDAVQPATTGTAPPVADRTAVLPRQDPAIPGAVLAADHDRPHGSADDGRRRSVGFRLFQVAALVLLALVGYYGFTLWQVWSAGRSDQARPVDAIVVMGAAQYDGRPSPQLAARLDHVLTLWPRDLAPLVVVTGGNIPGDRFTEAEASAGYLTERGVPESAIVQEGTGSTSYESLEAVAAMLEARGLDSVLIVTDPYHSLRSRLIAEEVGLEAYVSPTPTSVVTGGASLRRHVTEAAGVAVGRVVGFDRLSGISG